MVICESRLRGGERDRGTAEVAAPSPPWDKPASGIMDPEGWRGLGGADGGSGSCRGWGWEDGQDHREGLLRKLLLHRPPFQTRHASPHHMHERWAVFSLSLIVPLKAWLHRGFQVRVPSPSGAIKHRPEWGPAFSLRPRERRQGLSQGQGLLLLRLPAPPPLPPHGLPCREEELSMPAGLLGSS